VGTTPDAGRRTLQRVYVERLAAIIDPPPAPAAPPGAAPPTQPPPTPPPFVAAPNLSRSDLPALARAQLRDVREQSRRAATASNGVARAHWQDIGDRIDAIFRVKTGG
jgi:hypothetical protein